MNKFDINVAIIGVGRWGKNLVREFDHLCNVVGYVTRGNSVNTGWMDEHYPNIPRMELADALADKSINSVVIAVPINVLDYITKKALRANKHVFVEKPGAKSADDIMSNAELANARGLQYFVGYVRLYDECYQYIKKYAQDSGDKLNFVHGSWNKVPGSTSSTLWNLSSHDLSIAIDLLGLPLNSKCLERCYVKAPDDIITLELDYLTCKFTSHINRVSTITLKQMYFGFDRRQFLWENGILVESNKFCTYERIYVPDMDSPLRSECRDFLTSINLNKENTNHLLAAKVAHIIGSL